MSEERKLTFMGAINEAIDQSMEQDDNVILIGTDVSGGAGVEHIKDDDTFGGVFGVTKGLAKNIVEIVLLTHNRRAYYTQLCCRCSYRYASYCRINVQ